MKYYVVHHLPLTERKDHVETQLKKRGIVAEWITDFPPDDERVRKVKELTKSPLSLGYISLSMKHYTVFKKMVEENIPEAIVFEDDVVITDHFDVDKIPRMVAPYIKLGIRPELLGKVQFSSEIVVQSNNGGTEAYYVTKHFAETFLYNINLQERIDLEIHNVLVQCYNSIEFLGAFMCYQRGDSVLQHDSPPFVPGNWQKYIIAKHETFTYGELLNA